MHCAEPCPSTGGSQHPANSSACTSVHPLLPPTITEVTVSALPSSEPSASSNLRSWQASCRVRPTYVAGLRSQHESSPGRPPAMTRHCASGGSWRQAPRSTLGPAALRATGSCSSPCGPTAAASRPAGSRRPACGPMAEGPGSNRQQAAVPLGAQGAPPSCSAAVSAGGPPHHSSRPELSQQEMPPTMQQTSAALKPRAAPACPTALTAAITWATGVRRTPEGGPGHRRAGATLRHTDFPALHPLARRRGKTQPSRPSSAATTACENSLAETDCARAKVRRLAVSTQLGRPPRSSALASPVHCKVRRLVMVSLGLPPRSSVLASPVHCKARRCTPPKPVAGASGGEVSRPA